MPTVAELRAKQSAIVAEIVRRLGKAIVAGNLVEARDIWSSLRPMLDKHLTISS